MGRGLTPGCEGAKRAKEGSLLATRCSFPSLALGPPSGLVLATVHHSHRAGTQAVVTGHTNAHSSSAAFPLLAPGLRTPLQKDFALRWFCNCLRLPLSLPHRLTSPELPPGLSVPSGHKPPTGSSRGGTYRHPNCCRTPRALLQRACF